MSEQSEVWAVVPAAGVGARMGPGAPKQYRQLGGKPLLVQTLLALAPSVEGLVVVVSNEEYDPQTLDQLREQEGIGGTLRSVVIGGDTRQASVARGVREVPDSAEIVLVHDAVRPLIQTELILAVIEAIQSSGAAAVAVPVADTLRRGAGGCFMETVDREGLWRMQTPQGARRETLLQAIQRSEEEGWAATDEAGLLQMAGVEVALVEGDERNLKVTRPADWPLAEALWAIQ